MDSTSIIDYAERSTEGIRGVIRGERSTCLSDFSKIFALFKCVVDRHGCRAPRSMRLWVLADLVAEWGVLFETASGGFGGALFYGLSMKYREFDI